MSARRRPATATQARASTNLDEAGDDSLPDEAWLIALAKLPEMTPGRLRALTDDRSARLAWRSLRSGECHDATARRSLGRVTRATAARWAREADQLDVAALWMQHCEAGVCVAGRTSPGYPECLVDDPNPPAMLTWRGDIGALDRARVAVVGTRDCSLYGYEAARALGRDLAGSGVAVVSGLALGVDGAAHRGALEAAAAPPVGVVGAGLDVVYPRRNAGLWAEVADKGLLCSEQPLGTTIEPWQFPARNRIIAALADLVVVVESHSHGGSLITAEEALKRGRPVMATPGPVGAPASAGANDLLADGAGVCRGAEDVLAMLQLDSSAQSRAEAARPLPSPGARVVLEAMGWQATTIEQLMVRTCKSLAGLACTLDELEERGWVALRGGWYERVGAGTAPSGVRGRRPASERRL